MAREKRLRWCVARRWRRRGEVGELLRAAATPTSAAAEVAGAEALAAARGLLWLAEAALRAARAVLAGVPDEAGEVVVDEDSAEDDSDWLAEGPALCAPEAEGFSGEPRGVRLLLAKLVI